MKLEFRDYQLRVNDTSPRAYVLPLVEKIIDETLHFQDVFRSNNTTFIARFSYEGKELVLKIPRGRNSRYWERMLTIFRRGECSRVFLGMLKLQELNFAGAIPLVAGEKKKFGMVVNSFLVYEYLEGDTAGLDDAQQIVDLLLNLHAKNYIRRDAKLVNFVRTSNGIALIDFRLKKPVFLPSLQCQLELVAFLRRYPAELPVSVENSLWHVAARQLDSLFRTVKTGRKKLKFLFSDK